MITTIYDKAYMQGKYTEMTVEEYCKRNDEREVDVYIHRHALNAMPVEERKENFDIIIEDIPKNGKLFSISMLVRKNNVSFKQFKKYLDEWSELNGYILASCSSRGSRLIKK